MYITYYGKIIYKKNVFRIFEKRLIIKRLVSDRKTSSDFITN